jgi:propanol-preferring alcohol dehydrogenase
MEIPKTCKAGVVVNEGPDFKLVVEDVPVPEPGMFRNFERTHKREY